MTYTVYFEDTGEERKVVGVCKRCKERSGMLGGLDEQSAPIVGPRGIAHDQRFWDDGHTVCGKDATGEKWWWRL